MSRYPALAARLQQIDDWVGAGAVTGASVTVRYRGEEVAAHAVGEAQPGVPVTDRTLFGLASVSKPVTAAVVMALVDDGQISLEEPVARFVPEFAAPSAEGNPTWEASRGLVTIRHVLAHLSGLPEDLPPRTLRARDMPTLAELTDSLIALPLQFEPGTELRYSNAGYALLGRLIERVTGRDIWAFAHERLLGPMGLEDIVARPGPEDAGRIATVADASHGGTVYESYNSQYWRDLAIPWGGLFGTTAAVADFAERFQTSRALPISPAARRLMTTDQAEGVDGGLTSLRLVWRPAFWGFGWEVKGSKRRHWTGDYTSPATWCHWGAAGTLAWCDPETGITVAVFGNRITYNLWPFQPYARWARLSNAIVAAIGEGRS
ncbi:MAG: beta-lactamase family protein [Chloroflexota bacterium]|nr:beta-lactamase family protein [Chloroflexota bacterium]